MVLEEFSTSYYLTELYVEMGKENAKVNDQYYRDLQYEIHHTGSVEQEILFQLDGVFFAVEPSRNIPTGVIELPNELIENTSIKNPPTLRGLMLPKPWFYQFLKEPSFEQSEPL